MTLLIILCLFLVLAWVLLFVVFSEFIAFIRTRVPFVPTTSSDIEFFVKKLGIKSSDTFYDLGSGNGRVVFIVEKLSGARSQGFELGWWTILFAKLKAKTRGYKAKFVNKNFFKENWSGANYIYGYLYPPLMARVEAKFLADCKPGSIAVIRDFPLPNLKPTETYFMPRKHEIYIYKKV